MAPLIVKVPKVPRPKHAKGPCWTTAPGEANGYCTKPVGHKGPHTWQRRQRRGGR